MVRKKYSSDVPRLPWFTNALDQISGERQAERERISEQEKLRKEMEERELEELHCKKEHNTRLQWLSEQPTHRVSHAVNHCVSRGYIQPVIVSDLKDWSRFAAGMVYTYMTRA